jgi:molybdate transport system substrate-binding protein
VEETLPLRRAETAPKEARSFFALLEPIKPCYNPRMTSSHLVRPCILRIAAALAALLLSVSAVFAAPVLKVAAAADLASCIEELNAGFARSIGGADVTASIGSSGNFFAQIKNGAPFDVFLSADTFYPRELARAGLADPATLTVYAHGRLVMWTRDPALKLDAGFRILTDPRIRHIAIANPDVAPYGRAAKAALEKAGIWQAVRHKLVFGENVAQTVQFIETGNAQVGFVGSAHINTGGRMSAGHVWVLPADAYPLIEQGAIVTARGRANPAAFKYIAFLRSAAGRAILIKYGFTLPQVRG